MECPNVLCQRSSSGKPEHFFWTAVYAINVQTMDLHRLVFPHSINQTSAYSEGNNMSLQASAHLAPNYASQHLWIHSLNFWIIILEIPQ